MSNPPTQNATAAPRSSGTVMSVRPLTAIHAATGASASDRAEPEVREAREPLGQRVAEDEEQTAARRDTAATGSAVRESRRAAWTRRNRSTTDEREEPTTAADERPGGEVARRGAGVLGVDVPVGEAVERHRGAAGEHHAQQDAKQVLPAERSSSAQARAAARNAKGRAKSVWLKRMSSRSLRNALGMVVL